MHSYLWECGWGPRDLLWIGEAFACFGTFVSDHWGFWYGRLAVANKASPDGHFVPCPFVLLAWRGFVGLRTLWPRWCIAWMSVSSIGIWMHYCRGWVIPNGGVWRIGRWGGWRIWRVWVQVWGWPIAIGRVMGVWPIVRHRQVPLHLPHMKRQNQYVK